MEAQVIAQRDFSAGQLDETALRADDTEVMRAGLRTARNVRILNTRALKRRPGRRALFGTTGIVELVRPASGEIWWMILESGRAVFRRRNLSLTFTFAGLPWDSSILDELSFTESGSAIIIAHQSRRPQVFTFDVSTGAWAHAEFGFAEDPTGALRQPFHNFHLGAGVTMTPTARVGTITVTFSAPVLNAAHDGVIFRYGERQMRLETILSSTQALAVVLEELPPTYNVQLDTMLGLQAGDVVEGLESGAKGQVTLIDGSDVQILVTQNWSGFEVDEILVGPRSRGTVTACAIQSPTGSVLWDEALCSDYRGWPGCVSKDSQRIIFTRFAQLGQAIVWSAIGTLNDFQVGSERDEAIFEFIPDRATVLDVIGGADEFVFTDQGVYYIPVSETNPLIPGSVAFREISTDAAAPVRPRPTADGLVYLNASRTRVLALIGTGQTAKPYLVDDITEYHSPLIGTPVVLATTSADVAAPERYLYAVNADGTMAVARYQRQSGGRGWVGWVPWDGQGKVKWVTAGGADVAVVAEYQTGAGVFRYVEVFDEDLLLDGTRLLTSRTGADVLELDPGNPLLLASRNALALDFSWRFNWAPGVTVSVERNGWYRGDYMVQSDGTLSGEVPIGATEAMNAGFRFEVEVEPFVPHVEPGQSRKQRLRKRRLKHLAATVQHTQALQVAGRLIPFWQGGESQEEAPPLRSETYRARQLGRAFDPRWRVVQELPGQLTILELTTEVTF